MHLLNIQNSFNNLTLREKIILYIFPLIIFYFFYELDFFKEKDKINIYTYNKTVILKTKNLQKIASKYLLIKSIRNSNRRIILEAEGKYKNIFLFIKNLEKKNIRVVFLDLSKDNNKINIYIEIDKFITLRG